MSPNLRICTVCKETRYYSHDSRPPKGEAICSKCRNVNRWRKCAHCEATFLAPHRNDPQKFCSYTCMGLAKKTRFERPCLECGAMYLPKRESARWCSIACSAVGRRKPKTEFECEQCHGSFTPSQGRKAVKYCSLQCAGKAKRKTPDQPKPEVQDTWCGVSIDEFLDGVDQDTPATAPESDPDDLGRELEGLTPIELWLKHGRYGETVLATYERMTGTHVASHGVLQS